MHHLSFKHKSDAFQIAFCYKSHIQLFSLNTQSERKLQNQTDRSHESAVLDETVGRLTCPAWWWSSLFLFHGRSSTGRGPPESSWCCPGDTQGQGRQPWRTEEGRWSLASSLEGERGSSQLKSDGRREESVEAKNPPGHSPLMDCMLQVLQHKACSNTEGPITIHEWEISSVVPPACSPASGGIKRRNPAAQGVRGSISRPVVDHSEVWSPADGGERDF